jgi:hypothetical protein
MTVLLIMALLYFVPSVIAFAANRRNVAGIVLVNLLLGWTFLGWVVALVWATIPDAEVLVLPGHLYAQESDAVAQEPTPD